MPKLRVYELAKELGTDSKTILAEIERLGGFARAASTPLPSDVVRRVRQAWADQQPSPAPTRTVLRIGELAKELHTKPDVLLAELQRLGYRIPRPFSPLTSEEIAAARRAFQAGSPPTPAARWKTEDVARNLDPAWGRTRYALVSKSREWAAIHLPAHAEALAAGIRSGGLRLRAPAEVMAESVSSGDLFWLPSTQVRKTRRSGVVDLQHEFPIGTPAGLVGFAEPLPAETGAAWVLDGYPLPGDVVFRSVSWNHAGDVVHVVGWRLVDRRDAASLSDSLGYDVRQAPSWPWIPTVQITLPDTAEVDLRRVADPAKRACLAAVARVWAQVRSGSSTRVPRDAVAEAPQTRQAEPAQATPTDDTAGAQQDDAAPPEPAPIVTGQSPRPGVSIAELARDLDVPVSHVRAVARGFAVSIAPVGETVLGPLHAAAVRAVVTGRAAIASTRCDDTWHPADKDDQRWLVDGCGCGRLEHPTQDVRHARALNRRHAMAAAARGHTDQPSTAEQATPAAAPAPTATHPTSAPALLGLTGLAGELDMPVVALRSRMLRDHEDPTLEPIPAHLVERYRLLGGAWLTLTATRHPGDIDPATPSNATLTGLAAHLRTSTTDLAAAVRDLTGTTPDHDAPLPGYVVEAVLADAADTAPPPGTPVPWSPRNLPTHVDRLIETLTTWNRHQHGATAAALTDAILVWARPAIWTTTPTPEHGATVEDLIPFPVGLTALETPIPQPDGTALAAISWRYDDRAYTVTTQTWTTTPGQLRAGLDWTPHARHTLNMTARLPHDTTTHLGALRHIWAALAVTETLAAPRRAHQSSPSPAGERQRSTRDAGGQAVAIVHWRRQRPLRDETTRAQQSQSHRDNDLVWRVRGHWRWARVGPGGADRRRVWVHEHFKGHGTEAQARRVFILDS